MRCCRCDRNTRDGLSLSFCLILQLVRLIIWLWWLIWFSNLFWNWPPLSACNSYSILRWCDHQMFQTTKPVLGTFLFIFFSYSSPIWRHYFVYLVGAVIHSECGAALSQSSYINPQSKRRRWNIYNLSWFSWHVGYWWARLVVYMIWYGDSGLRKIDNKSLQRCGEINQAVIGGEAHPASNICACALSLSLRDRVFINSICNSSVCMIKGTKYMSYKHTSNVSSVFFTSYSTTYPPTHMLYHPPSKLTEFSYHS